MKSSQNALDYCHIVRKLTQAEGGGYLIEFPDLPGCMSNGETLGDALANGNDAVSGWLKAAE